MPVCYPALVCHCVSTCFTDPIGELQHALSGKPEYRPFDPPAMCDQPYPITEYQPVLFVAESLADATEKLKAYSATLKRVA